MENRFFRDYAGLETGSGSPQDSTDISAEVDGILEDREYDRIDSDTAKQAILELIQSEQGWQEAKKWMDKYLTETAELREQIEGLKAEIESLKKRNKQ